jgi:hypothetical protein
MSLAPAGEVADREVLAETGIAACLPGFTPTK